MENLFDKTTQLWVRFTGRRIDIAEQGWLDGPIGDSDKIGDQFIHRLKKENNFSLVVNEPDSGLLDSIGDLKFDEAELKRIRPEVVHFYTNTSNYNFEIWSAWNGLFKPFGWLLSFLFSKRLQQLNLPLDPLDSAKGLKSDIIKLKRDGKTVWTIWYRTIRSNDQVIYAGVYTTCTPTALRRPLFKVIFPLPNGNACVLMERKVLDDGSLLLSSDGKRFGEQGFYFTLTNHKGKHWAKYVKALHEWIKVYVDDQGILRADHNLNFYGMRFLNLHYKMAAKKS